MLLDFLFPRLCVGCGQFGGYFCRQCEEKITQLDLVCPICERPSVGGRTHPLCHKKYGLDGLWSLGAYQEPLKTAISKLKYQFVSDITPTLVGLLINYWVKFPPLFLDQVKQDFGQNWIIVPIPLHPKRQNFRGFNQSALIGKILSKSLNLGYQEALKRIKNTHPQVDLEAYQRKRNIKDAFSINTKYPIKGVKVLLIDDVWTTGSTLRECGYVLKKSGAGMVWAITLAR